ncbi:hypothetical protein Acsp03_59970 [Actinomadura sp. NBRC 104412]|uniref:hypothetical protein n=1 Tax=Actinomadura sp. NBRC 104412 TaxID=3032203 RepID=UPI0024A348B8|nr:hypothetical protein [Actinomadura sp. NBRC 104412]GLZ08531.1 hypothetical protein Acsp03_59970 [Actinomadura sp. NBRC 104412]
MNRYTRNPTRLGVVVPAVAVAALAAVAAPALAASGPADSGPIAYLTKDSTGRSAIGPVADKATPIVRSVGMSLDGLTNSTSVSSSATRHGAMTRLGPGTIKTAHGDMRFSSMAVRCGSRFDEVLYGVMTLDPQGALAPALQGVPRQPTESYRIPAAVPGKEFVLNKQVRDASGALTVTAITVTDKATGASRGYGVARCTPSTLPAASGVPARSRNPLPVPATGGPVNRGGALPPAAVDSLNGLLNSVQLGTLPKEPATGGWGAVLEPENAGVTQLGSSAAQPRPARRGQAAGHPVPGAPMAGLPAMLAGPTNAVLPASMAALLGGAPGLPLAG